MKYRKQHGALIAVAAVWGSLYLIAKRWGGSSILDFLILRFGFASLALLPLALRRGWQYKRETLISGAGAGLCLAAVYLCLMGALQYSDSSTVGVICALTIAFLPMIDFVLTRRDIPPQTGLGICLGILGLRFFSTASGASGAMGIFLALLGAIFLAIYFLLVERIPRTVDVIQVSFVQMVCVMGLCIALRLMVAPLQPTTQTDSSVLLAAVICGVLGNAIGYTVQTWGQRFISSHRVALILSLESPFAVLFGVLGQESLSLGMILGCLVMFAGVWLVLSSAGHASVTPAPQSVTEGA